MAQEGVAAFHRQDVIKILIGLRIEKRLQQQMAFQDLTLLFKTLDAHIRQLNDQPVIGDRTAGYGQDGKQLIEADGFFTDQRCIQQPQ